MNLEFVRKLRIRQQFNGQFAEGFCCGFLKACMKRDGRKFTYNTLEENRVPAVQRMNEGEHPEAVAASRGMNRSWAYKCRASAKGRGRGLKTLHSTKGSGRPRKLTPIQNTMSTVGSTVPVFGSFALTTTASCLRLVTANLAEQDEEWMTAKIYLTMKP